MDANTAKFYAIQAILIQSDDFILWFVGDNGAYCFMADRQYTWKEVAKHFRPTLLLSQSTDLEHLLGGCSDSQWTVRGTVKQLKTVLRKAEDLRDTKKVA